MKSSQGSLKTLIAEIAEYHRKDLTDSELDVWRQDLARYPVQQVRAAWEKHRVGSPFFPFIADLRRHLPDLVEAKSVVRKADCTNPECSSGWVLAYSKQGGIRFMKRCAVCHPFPDLEKYADYFGTPKSV